MAFLETLITPTQEKQKTTTPTSGGFLGSLSTETKPKVQINPAPQFGNALGPTAQSTKAIPDETTPNLNPVDLFLPRKEAVEVRRPFETTPIKTKAPPIVTGAATFGNMLLEAIPRGLATLYGEVKSYNEEAGKATGLNKTPKETVNIGINARRLGYENDEYTPAVKEIADRVSKGESPWTAGLGVVSGKILDVSVAGQVLKDVAQISTKILLKGGQEAQMEAWNILGKPRTIEEAKLNFRKKAFQLHPDTGGSPEQFSTVRTAFNTLEKEGVPSMTTQAKSTVGRYTEVLGRETPLGKGFLDNIAKPDITPKEVKPEVNKISGLLGGEKISDNQAPAFGLSVQKVEKVPTVKAPIYEGEKDLSTKILDDLKGKSTVSKQYILDSTNRPELKQTERDTVREVLKDYPDGSQVPVAEFAGKVKAELLPLEAYQSGMVTKNGTNIDAKYEHITLPSEIRGPIENYEERVYQSPIKTSAGGVHFNKTETPKYFGHTRVEDVPGDTRRVIEVQSDLYQKGNLERETKMRVARANEDIPYNTSKETGAEIDAKFKEAENKAQKEVNQLQQYNDPTAHFRMVREEIKKAAEDGKTKLQFPTGETAMKIEGLGDNSLWYNIRDDGNTGNILKEADLKVGHEIKSGPPGNWIITQVIGGGKFTAIPLKIWKKEGFSNIKDFRESYPESEGGHSSEENFDISGEIDTQNPIYRFYEKDLGRYLTNKYGAKVITDKQGVSWYEIPITKEMAKAPVQAFKTGAGKFDISKEDAKHIVRKFFSQSEVGVLFSVDLGKNIEGFFKPSGIRNTIALLEKEGLTSKSTAYHEIFHAVFKLRFSEAERSEAIQKVLSDKRIMQDVQYSSKQYSTPEMRAEEWLADDFARFKQDPPKYSGFFRNLWEKLLNYVRGLIRRSNSFEKLYDDVETRKTSINKIKEGRNLPEEIRFKDSSDDDISYLYDGEESLGEQAKEKSIEIGNSDESKIDNSQKKEIGQSYAKQNASPLGSNRAHASLDNTIARKVGEVKVGGKTVDITKGGKMEIPVEKKVETKDVLQSNIEKGKQPLSTSVQKTPSKFPLSENQKGFSKTKNESPKLKEEPAKSPEKPQLREKSKLDTEDKQLSVSSKESIPLSSSEVKQDVDSFIKEGKIRVVSINNKDVYQVKKGRAWFDARDADSAVRQVMPVQKPAPEVKNLPPEIEKKAVELEMKKHALDEMQLKPLEKYVVKNGNMKGSLPELGVGESKFAKEGDQIIDNTVGHGEDAEEIRTKFEDEYLPLKKEVKDLEAEVKKETKEAKDNGKMLTTREIEAREKIRSLREDIKVLESSGLDATKQKEQIKRLVVENKIALSTKGTTFGVTKEGIPRHLNKKQREIFIKSPYTHIDVPPEVREPLGGSYGEVKSVQILAKQAESFLHGTPIPPDVRMNEILGKTVTPVTSKVHLFDTYLRTPDRVMKKIGFGEEAKELRGAMDEYWKELPKNLEKIGKWAKEVPSSSNLRIFKYLDGEAIDLRPEEKRVADEIKAWLREWADRLGLEKDQRVSDYITRIFGGDTIKEFDEELAKIITDRIPGSVYNPFTLKRLGNKGYKQDTWKALEAYAKRGTRKVHMDPVLEKIQARTGSALDVSNIEKSQFLYIKRYINNINLRPSEFDESIDNFIKSVFTNKTVAKGYRGLQKGSMGLLPDIGQRPVASITRFLRQMTFRGMLGLNLSSALRNVSQGVNTYAILGEKYTTIGYANLFKSQSYDELTKEGVLNAGFVQDKVLSATGKLLEKSDKGLFAFFDTTEKINRGAAYFGAKAKYYNAHTKIMDGVTVMPADIEEKAIEYAKGIVRKTQFSFDVVDTPVGMQSDIVKTLVQMQSYTTKQIEFLTELVRDKNYSGIIRYIIGGLLFVSTIGKIFGMKPQELLPIYRLGVPPSLKLPWEIGKAGFNTPDSYGKVPSSSKKLSNIGNATFTGLVPAGSQIKKTYQGFNAVRKGGSFDSVGKKQFSVGGGLGKNIQAIAFGKYANQNAQDYFAGVSEAERTYNNLVKSKTAKADFDKIIKNNPALAKQVIALKKKRDAGITVEDDKIINMGVASGQRAKFVADKLNKLKTVEEKKALWSEYVKKKIITKDVATQVVELLK